jgi:hypothetical protein
MKFRNDTDNSIEEWDPKDRTGVPYRGGTIHHPDQKTPMWQPAADPELVEKAYGEEAENVEEQKILGYAGPMEEPPYVTPIPVNVVELPTAHEFKHATFREVTVGDSLPVRVAGRDKTRTKLVLSNPASDTSVLFVGDTPTISAGSGNCFRLRVDNFLVLETQEEVYIVSESGDALCGVVQEFVQRT